LHSPAAQILETALALQRAPGERFRLRERPLPPGILHLIEIAAGSPQALHAAASELGEPDASVLEAARFYLEQVLFADPGADAYRVLGVASDVPHEDIRTHHRWLQRWLHPDRAQAGDASIFATRVNQAFAQLRSPESRHAYDVRLAEARLASASAPLDPVTVRHWERQDAAPRHGRRSRWLLAAALVSCVVLAVLIVRNPENGATWEPHDDGSAAADPADPGPAIEDRDLGVLSAALALPAAAAPDPAATTDVVAPEAAVPASTPPENPPAMPLQPAPAPATSVATASIAAPAASPPRSAAPDSPSRRVDHGAAVVSSVSTVPATPQIAPVRPTTEAEPAQMKVADVTTTAAPSSAPPPAAIAQASSPAPHAAPAEQDPAEILERMRQAEQRVAQVAAYLSAKPGAAPMWNDPQTEAEAARLRAQLNARKGSKLELTRPAWRLQRDNASLSADYRCRSADDGPCQGRLDVKLVWREGLWLVRDVGLGPSA
jgi:hypothetical protein